MQMNPNLILQAGQTADVFGSLERGNALAQQVNKQRQQNALTEFMRDNGAGLMQGDQNALNAYAALDPMGAMQLQQRQQDRAWQVEDRQYQRGRDQRQDQRDDRQESRLSQQHQLALKKYAAETSAEQLAADRDLTRRAVQAVWDAKTEQDWDAGADAFNAPHLKGKFANKRAILMELMDQDDFLASIKPPAPLSGPGKVYADIQAGRLPADTPLQGGGQRINVSTGTVPQGYRNVYDDAGNLVSQEPIPGGPADTSKKDAARQAQAANAAGIVVQDIDKAIGQVSGWTAGAGSALSAIPGSGARNLQASLDTVRANIGFDRLQQMRDASPTGGALGGIAIQELQMLQSVLGSLDTAQSPEQLKANLERLKQVYEPIAKKAAAYPNASEFGFSDQSEQPDMSDDDLLKKYGG